VAQTLAPAFSAPAGPNAVNAVIGFDPTASVIGAGDKYTSETWNFGDGSPTSFRSFTTPSATLNPASHSFAARGSYAVTLKVVDSSGNLATITHQVPIGTPPVAAFSAPASGVRTVAVSFDASGTTDPDGAPITSYQWNFGDGSAGSGIATTHAYAANGSYTVTLTVTDSDGLTNTVSHQIAVHTPPTAAFTPPSGGIVGTTVSFSSQTTAGDGTLASYAWDFGDGTSGSGASTSHVYSTAGSFTVTLTVTDSNNLTSSISGTVRIGRKPTAVLRVLTKQPFAGAATAFDGSGSSDPGSTISRWSWSFGDGGAGSGASTSHTYKKAGSYLVLLTVSDVNGASSTVSTTVKVMADTITKVKADHGRSIKITVSGPGTLTIGKHKIEVKRAASVTVKLPLTNAQAHTLATHHKLNLRLKITFLPAGGGGRVIETVHITLHL